MQERMVVRGGNHMKKYKCSFEIHKKCENNAICHLCDGSSLYKNTSEEKAAKREAAARRKEEEKHALLKTHKEEKKEGMAFEKRVAKRWNNFMNKNEQSGPLLKTSQKKHKVGKPRIDLSDIMESDSNEEQNEVVEEKFTAGLKGLTPGGMRTNVKNVPKGPRPPAPAPQRPREEAKRQINSGAMWHSKGDIKLDHALMECKERGTKTARGAKTISIPKEWLDKQEKEAFQEQREYWYLPFGYKGDDAIYLVKPFDHELELIYELRKAREKIEELEAALKEVNNE